MLSFAVGTGIGGLIASVALYTAGPPAGSAGCPTGPGGWRFGGGGIIVGSAARSGDLLLATDGVAGRLDGVGVLLVSR